MTKHKVCKVFDEEDGIHRKSHSSSNQKIEVFLYTYLLFKLTSACSFYPF